MASGPAELFARIDNEYLERTAASEGLVMTTLDGYQMARNGRAGAALAVSAIGSFIAGTIGIVLLSLLSKPLAQLALQFGPPEYFTLMVFSMLSAASLGGRTVGVVANNPLRLGGCLDSASAEKAEHG